MLFRSNDTATTEIYTGPYTLSLHDALPISVRCAPAADLPVTRVFLLYREPVKQRFTEVEMKRAATGWFQGRIPERVIYGASLQYFFEGRDAAGKPIAHNGDAHDPNRIFIVKR